MSLGPLMLDLAGTTLDAVERERLRHPLVGGVILFSRNYESPRQIDALVREIHSLREPQLLVAVEEFQMNMGMLVVLAVEQLLVVQMV